MVRDASTGCGVTPMNRPVATVERAVAILRELADAPEDLGNNELARRTGVNPSTVSRLLATLADAGLVRRAPDSGRFRLGPRLVELGIAALARVDLRQLDSRALRAWVTVLYQLPADDEGRLADYLAERG